MQRDTVHTLGSGTQQVLNNDTMLVAVLGKPPLLRTGQSDFTLLNESQREAGCLFQEPTHSAPSLPGLVSRAWFSTQLEGLAGQAEGGGRSWRGSPADSGDCPPQPLVPAF